MVSYNVIIGDTITKIAVRISGRELHFLLLCRLFHRNCTLCASSWTEAFHAVMQKSSF